MLFQRRPHWKAGRKGRSVFARRVVYGLKFDTPADEFQHKLDRGRSYDEAIPLALKQFNPSYETALIIERYTVRSKELRDVAQKQVGKGDYPAALKTIQDATSQLQRSLQMAEGLVPQSQEGSNP